MNMREGLQQYKSAHRIDDASGGENFYGVKTPQDGEYHFYADRMLINDSGSLMFTRKLSDGSFYPVIAFGAREYVMAYRADPKTKQPLVLE
jgi:hypothetical protein